jgi:dTDP-4-dehydrorhamnose reductase
MLGNTVIDVFSQDSSYEVWGTLRSASALRYFAEEQRARLLVGVDVLDQDALVRALDMVRPNVVINCVGLIKQLADAQDPLSTLPVNAMFPHRLARLCGLADIRVIHVSTDCVFSGRTGAYTESDPSDAEDLYGKSKFIGELHDLKHAITIRTSIIGHELNSNFALVDWFLSQTGAVRGFAKAIFSGLPTVELASVIKDRVLTHPELHGLYHVAAAPITKLELLRLISRQYKKEIDIVPDECLVIDRSLNYERFRQATGYVAPAWPDLIEKMFYGSYRRSAR